MLKKTITYKNFNEETISEVYAFHLSKADLIEMNVSKKGGFAVWFEAMTKSDDQAAIYAEIKKLIMKSYGIISDDGRRFIQNQELLDDFMQSGAYSEVIAELCTNETAAAEFIAGAIPHGLDEELAKQIAKQKATLVAADAVPEVFVPTSDRILTRQDLIEMDTDEIKSLIAQGATIEQTDV